MPSCHARSNGLALSVPPLWIESESPGNDRHREPEYPASSLEFVLVCCRMLRDLRHEACVRPRAIQPTGRRTLSLGLIESVPESRDCARRRKGSRSYKRGPSLWNEGHRLLAHRKGL